jgi:hypothetical protein
MTDVELAGTTRRGKVLWSHTTTLPAQPDSVRSARDFICSRLRQHDLQYLSDDIRLVISELATNATVHAATPFTVTVAGHRQLLVLSVQDASASLPATRPASLTATGGRGLSIVAGMSSDWGVTTADSKGRKSVWASFDLTLPDAASAYGLLALCGAVAVNARRTLLRCSAPLDWTGHGIDDLDIDQQYESPPEGIDHQPTGRCEIPEFQFVDLQANTV